MRHRFKVTDVTATPVVACVVKLQPFWNRALFGLVGHDVDTSVLPSGEDRDDPVAISVDASRPVDAPAHGVDSDPSLQPL